MCMFYESLILETRLQMVTAGKLSSFSLVSVIEVAIGSCASWMIFEMVTVQNPMMAVTMTTPQNMRFVHDLLTKTYRAPLNVELSKNFSALLLQLGLMLSSPFSLIMNVSVFLLMFLADASFHGWTIIGWMLLWIGVELICFYSYCWKIVRWKAMGNLEDKH